MKLVDDNSRSRPMRSWSSPAQNLSAEQYLAFAVEIGPL
jgi:hypothetical protein